MTRPELFDMQTGRVEHTGNLETGLAKSSVKLETESWGKSGTGIGNNSHEETNRIILLTLNGRGDGHKLPPSHF
jgi:hypothetical protein